MLCLLHMAGGSDFNSGLALKINVMSAESSFLSCSPIKYLIIFIKVYKAQDDVL